MNYSRWTSLPTVNPRESLGQFLLRMRTLHNKNQKYIRMIIYWLNTQNTEVFCPELQGVKYRKEWRAAADILELKHFSLDIKNPQSEFLKRYVYIISPENTSITSTEKLRKHLKL